MFVLVDKQYDGGKVDFPVVNHDGDVARIHPSGVSAGMMFSSRLKEKSAQIANMIGESGHPCLIHAFCVFHPLFVSPCFTANCGSL